MCIFNCLVMYLFKGFLKTKKKKAKSMELLYLKEVKTWHRVCSLHFNKNDYLQGM